MGVTACPTVCLAGLPPSVPARAGDGLFGGSLLSKTPFHLIPIEVSLFLKNVSFYLFRFSFLTHFYVQVPYG